MVLSKRVTLCGAEVNLSVNHLVEGQLASYFLAKVSERFGWLI